MPEQSSTHKLPLPDDSAGELDPKSMAAIRSLLTDEGQDQPKAKRARLPRSVRQTVAEMIRNTPEPETAETAETAKAAEPEPAEPVVERHGPFEPLAPQDAEPSEPARAEGFLARKKASLLAYRPTRNHIIWAVLALFLLFRPGLVIGVLVLILLAIFVVFMVLGYDCFWHSVMRFGHWYARRRPSKAAELHAKLDQFAQKWDAFLDRFPEGTVDGLYLPDFGELERAEAAHDAALTRRLQELEKS